MANGMGKKWDVQQKAYSHSPLYGKRYNNIKVQYALKAPVVNCSGLLHANKPKSFHNLLWAVDDLF